LNLFGIQGSLKFEELVKQIAAYDNANYDLDQNIEEEKLSNQFDKIYGHKINDVQVEYMESMGLYFQLLCKKALTCLLKGLNVNELASLSLKKDQSLEKFANYVIISANEIATESKSSKSLSSQDEFFAFLIKLIKESNESEEIMKLMEILYNKSIVNHNLKLLVETLMNGSTLNSPNFTDELNEKNTINALLVPKIVKLFNSEVPFIIYKNPMMFCNTISMLLMICLAYRSENELKREAYT